MAIATPPATHAPIALRCLAAGRHVLVEKPLADSYDAGLQMVREAEQRGLVLHCDHTFCYTPAVQMIRELSPAASSATSSTTTPSGSTSGSCSKSSTSSGIWRRTTSRSSTSSSEDGREPLSVSAQGADPLGLGHACVGYLTLAFDDGLLAHCHLNWLSPTKIRTTIVGGSERMVVWNDLLPAQRVSVYESGVELAETDLTRGEQRRRNVSYRIGSMTAPALREREALSGVLQDWTGAITTGRAPMTDGHAGLRVLRILEADAGVAARRRGAGAAAGTSAGGRVTAVAAPPTPVPGLDLRAQHAPLREEILAAWGRLLDAGAFVSGAGGRGLRGGVRRRLRGRALRRGLLGHRRARARAARARRATG